MKVKLEGNRLAFYHQKADATYWSEHWQEIDIKEWGRGARRNITFNIIFRKFLPRKGRILEAGCGLAQWVKLLQEKGYDVQGMDFAKNTIQRAKKHHHDLQLLIGDIFSLPYRDNSFDAIISLGVVEHFVEGPEVPIKEAYRVLKDGGIFLVSVPYFNPLRKFKSRLGYYIPNINEQDEFYQYAYSKAEFEAILRSEGFTTLKTLSYDPIKGLKDEIPPLQVPLLSFISLLKKKRKPSQINKKPVTDVNPSSFNSLIYKVVEFFSSMTGRMILFVARKERVKH